MPISEYITEDGQLEVDLEELLAQKYGNDEKYLGRDWTSNLPYTI